MTTKLNQNTIHNPAFWNTSRGLSVYGKDLLFNCLILTGLLFLGMSTFGFEFQAVSPTINFLLNFIVYLIITTQMWFVSFWHTLLLSIFADPDKRQLELIDKIKKIPNAANRKSTIEYLQNNSVLPMNHTQRRALAIFFCMLLFELFYINAWVKGSDYHLVWQPHWVDIIVNWMKSNLSLPPIHKTEGLFIFDISDSILKDYYANEEVLLQSPLGTSGLLFHAWRCLTLIPITICFFIVLWRLINFIGMSRLDPRRINGNGRFVWASLVALVTLVMLFAFFGLFIGFIRAPDGMSLPMMLSNTMWLEKLYFYIIGFANIIIGLMLVVGWLGFWKNLLIRAFQYFTKAVDV